MRNLFSPLGKGQKTIKDKMISYLFLLVLAYTLPDPTKSITLDTKLGQIIGIDNVVPDVGTVYTFLKIPYAKPPTGELRLRKPLPHGEWSSTLNATSYGPSCMQPQYGITDLAANKEMSEDCLHLNIFVPYSINTTVLKSVMIWVHGGAYTTGQSSAYEGTSFSLAGDVILVTINYRLGFFGFFGTGERDLPGNFGLWDQHLAIKWVHDNIASFGGDPGAVTIFGESAGGGSVSFQSLYPGNRGLFQKVIAQSGIALSEFLRLQQSTLNRNVEAYFTYLNCSNVDIEESINCLRNLSTIEIQNTVDTVLLPYGGFSPMIDGDFIKGHAEKVLQSIESEEYQFFTSLDYMVGTLSGDGAVVLPAFFPPLVLEKMHFNITNGIPSSAIQFYLADFFAGFYQNRSSVNDGIRELYKNESSESIQGNLIVDLFSDFGFTFPALMSADFHYLRSKPRNKATTYVYYMTRMNKIQSIVFPGWTYPWLERVTHGMDVIYLFNKTVFNGQNEDFNLAGQMLTYWTNFAKRSNPNGPEVPFWPEYDGMARVQILDSDIKHENKNDIFGEKILFWLDDVHKKNITLRTDLGNITGVVSLVSGAGEIFAFKNIPYGKPPLAGLRFQKPQPYGAWEGTLDATAYGPVCMQDNNSMVLRKAMSEDCLQLNIFVPYSISPNVSKSVMIYIHGGAYSRGSGTSLDGTMFTLRGNVILVNINYRLGPFGFLSTQDSVVPGNLGLWDQRMAFQWVQDNIHAFGGNPNSVTIFGGSAGGGSVSFHSLYPGNRGLFHRVVSMSGVALSKIMQLDKENMNATTTVFLELHGCLQPNMTEAMDCLRALSANSLTGSEVFKPIIDGDIIINDFTEKLKDHSSDIFQFFTSLDYMTGVLDGDGNVELRLYIPLNAGREYNSSLESGLTTEFLCDYLAPFISATWYDNTTEINNGICNLYRTASSIVNQSNSITDLMTDFLFRFPAIKSADIHRQRNDGGSTYVYEMTRVYPLQEQAMPNWTYKWSQRAVHGMDRFYLLESDDRISSANQTSDLVLAHEMIEYWTNFAKTGKPDSTQMLPRWPQYGSTMKVQYLDINIRSQSNPHSGRKRFWLETVQKAVSGIAGSENGPTGSAATVQFTPLLFIFVLCSVLFS